MSNAADLLAAHVPQFVESNCPLAVSFTLRNTGDTTWPPNGPHPVGLGAVSVDGKPWQWPLLWTDAPGADPATKGVGRIPMPRDVPPGDEVQITATLYASENVLTNCSWRMVEDGTGWFGPTIPAQVWVHKPLFPQGWPDRCPDGGLVRGVVVNTDFFAMDARPRTEYPVEIVRMWRGKVPFGVRPPAEGPPPGVPPVADVRRTLGVELIQCWFGATGPVTGFPMGSVSDNATDLRNLRSGSILVTTTLDSYKCDRHWEKQVVYGTPGIICCSGDLLQFVAWSRAFGMPAGANWTAHWAIEMATRDL